ncbi:hypothetical protein LTR37_001813 [Vermiconidia calcicola]|uniref:Uncharacterized protein n=1 Tax=Vermiconidia calcicola TaxID=1690605 RepID=A0ACC3NUT2_9PEZI|nr:hypothetical protein LTR37_001813 [Vermiconidia calcicola]
MDSSSTLKASVAVPREVSDALEAKGLRVDNEGVVRWAPDSITHPRQWPLRRKVYDSAIIWFLEFFVTLVSNTGSSIAPVAANELAISTEVAIFCFTTVYLVGQAIGGLILCPIAESFGGRTIYLTSTAGFAITSILIAAWPILPVVIGGRFVTGLLSAMPAVVAAGSIENMWDMTSRTFVIHIWIAGAVVGLSLGPPIATFVSTSALGWHWMFIIAAIIMATVAIVCFGMQESRPSQVLRLEINAIFKRTKFEGLSAEGDDSVPSFKLFMRTSLLLPMRLFFTEPIVLITSIMAATVYGIIYLFSEALTIVYIDGYGFDSRQSSLVMLAVAVGVAFTFLPRIFDIHVAAKRRKDMTPLEPEDKLFGFLVAAPVLASGLWWFACTIPPLAINISPWSSIASLVLVGFSVVEFDSVLSGYLCDTYATYAASANAPMAFLRAILSGVFPLFGHRLFRDVGSNNALFILASVATGYCGIAVLFGVYGKRIRKRSPMAEKTWTAILSTETLIISKESIFVQTSVLPDV